MDEHELEKLWHTVRGELEIGISPASFSSWITPCFLNSVTKLDSERLLVELASPSAFHQRTLDERYYGQIKKILETQTGNKCELALIVKQKKPAENAPPPSSLFSNNIVTKEDMNQTVTQSGLNVRFSFANYVVGGSNNLAYAAAKAVVDNPGTKHNPLFIWGGVGVGKTHLMHSVGRALVEKGLKKVRVITSEQFTNELIAVFRSKNVADFKKRYREADALLVDDIQFIANKETTQEEFFHTFNELYSKQKQIIMTSDRRPQDIQQVEARLISRFLGGLTVDIGVPDYEMRCAILRQKAEELNVVAAEGAIEAIAENTSTNARELEGVFTGLVNAASLSNSILTKELVEKHLDIHHKPVNKKLRAQEVISIIAKHFEIKNKDLVGHNRKANLVKARQITMYLLREEMGLQLQRIAQMMGGRDHTTIMYGVEKMKKEISTNQDTREQIVSLRQELFV